jgi:hypothetical protein
MEISGKDLCFRIGDVLVATSYTDKKENSNFCVETISVII